MLIILCGYSSIRSTNITEGIKKTISTKEAEISKAISSTDRQLAEVETSLEELRLDGASEGQSQNVEDMANRVKQSKRNEMQLTLCGNCCEFGNSKERPKLPKTVASSPFC
jgi:hypothetical protein